jgi:hypothetical protein
MLATNGIGGGAASGVSISVADCVPFRLPAIVTGVAVATAVVPMLNVADVALAFTDTDAGTVAAALLLDNVTLTPVFDAALNVTVPCAPVPPTTVVGFTDNVEIDGGAGDGVVPPPLSPLALLPPHAFSANAASSVKASPNPDGRLIDRWLFMVTAPSQDER